jgi:hypothetical protein
MMAWGYVVGAGLLISAAAVATFASREPPTMVYPRVAAIAVAEHVTPVDRKVGCARQAVRVAAWRGRNTVGDYATDPTWTSHYSERDDVCYALIADSVPTANEQPPPEVKELWNAFEATLVATATSDQRRDVRRDFCRIDLADDPFTSCPVAEFFIRQRMSN